MIVYGGALRRIKAFIKRLMCDFGWDPWKKSSWSQEGEDMLLSRIFDGQLVGTYVDVGAHHPKRFSNTYLFYKLGWSGINIDAMPGSMYMFKKYRPRDINLEVGVGETEGLLDYYVFNEPALNGFSYELSKDRNDSDNNYKVISTIRVDVLPLAKILERHLNGKQIDFMSVDVEGWDLRVLKSNDWSKYRPLYVLVEMLQFEFARHTNNEIIDFMDSCAYDVYAKLVNTVIFKNRSKN